MDSGAAAFVVLFSVESFHPGGVEQPSPRIFVVGICFTQVVADVAVEK